MFNKPSASLKKFFGRVVFYAFDHEFNDKDLQLAKDLIVDYPILITDTQGYFNQSQLTDLVTRNSEILEYLPEGSITSQLMASLTKLDRPIKRLTYIDSEILRPVAQHLICLNPNQYSYLPEYLQEDKELVLIALEKSGVNFDRMYSIGQFNCLSDEQLTTITRNYFEECNSLYTNLTFEPKTNILDKHLRRYLKLPSSVY